MRHRLCCNITCWRCNPPDRNEQTQAEVIESFPRMPRIKHIARNVLSNWLALAVTTVTAFFLSPFVVHHLGNLAYGVWVIIMSLVAYMNLLDLGLRGAITRFVSKGCAQGNNEESSQAVSGALWIR